MSLWKRVELEIAKRLGGIRVPVPGRQRGSAPDIEHDFLSIEVKHRENLPKWLHDAMSQAVASQATDQHMPIVVLHEKQQAYNDAYVVIKLGDYCDWYVTPYKVS